METWRWRQTDRSVLRCSPCSHILLGSKLCSFQHLQIPRSSALSALHQAQLWTAWIHGYNLDLKDKTSSSYLSMMDAWRGVTFELWARQSKGLWLQYPRLEVGRAAAPSQITSTISSTMSYCRHALPCSHHPPATRWLYLFWVSTLFIIQQFLLDWYILQFKSNLHIEFTFHIHIHKRFSSTQIHP